MNDLDVIYISIIQYKMSYCTLDYKKIFFSFIEWK